MNNPFRYFNSSPEVIRLAVMMYIRYPLSLRQVEGILFERGIDIAHETVRYWWHRFGPMFAVDERVPRYFDMPDGALAHVNTPVTESVRKTSATYNEFLAPTGGGNSLIVHLDGPEGLYVVWLLARAGKPDDWSSNQLERVASLLPHMRRFVRVRQALAGADTSRVRSIWTCCSTGGLASSCWTGGVRIPILARFGALNRNSHSARSASAHPLRNRHTPSAIGRIGSIRVRQVQRHSRQRMDAVESPRRRSHRPSNSGKPRVGQGS